MTDQQRIADITAHLEPISHHPTITGDYCKHLKTAIAALRAEEEREKGCVFCGEERHRIREMFDDGTARILCSMNHYALSVETPADATSESIFPIYFCPMCGRNLDGGGQDARKGVADATALIESLQSQLTASQRRADAAVEDMKLIVDAVREAHCDETCCFACAFDCDTSINDSGVPNCECPGFERDDCFEWRGVKEERE